MTIYDSEFREVYKNLHLEDRGWLRVYYHAPAPNHDGKILETTFAKIRTVYDFTMLLLTLKNICMAIDVEVWDINGRPEIICLLKVDAETGQILI